MALIVSSATGNFNAGATWVGGVVPTIGDEARASTGHTITITANATCDEVSNAGTGIFTLNDGITLTANVSNKSTTASRACLQFTASSPAVGTIVGNVTSGPASSTMGINNINNGTLSITGNVTGGSAATAYGAYNSALGTITITGNATGGSGASSHAVQGQGNGTITITGNATGTVGFGANNVGTGTITIYGIATGGSSAVGINNASTGTVNLGRAKGNTYGPGNTSGLVATVGAANAGVGVIEIEQLEYGTFGQSPTSGTGIRLKKAGSNLAVFNFCDTAGAKTLIDATQNAAMPAASDVRSGVSYASGALTGSAYIPLASSVASGVPVDASVGSAVLTPEAVWSHATRTITGGLVDTATTLTNAPTVPTTSQIASQVRTELSVELGRIDATVSSRLAPSGTLATVTNLTNAPASVTPSDIWSHATRTITGGTVDTLTNAPTVPSAASIRAEIDSNSTQLAAIKAKTDLLPASPAATGDIPTAAQNATAVWSKPANELTVADSIGERAKQQSTVAITGAQLAAALS
jgi:hypothetical protein